MVVTWLEHDGCNAFHVDRTVGFGSLCTELMALADFVPKLTTVVATFFVLTTIYNIYFYYRLRLVFHHYIPPFDSLPFPPLHLGYHSRCISSYVHLLAPSVLKATDLLVFPFRRLSSLIVVYRSVGSKV